jgi:hypothetical protein
MPGMGAPAATFSFPFRTFANSDREMFNVFIFGEGNQQGLSELVQVLDGSWSLRWCLSAPRIQGDRQRQQRIPGRHPYYRLVYYFGIQVTHRVSSEVVCLFSLYFLWNLRGTKMTRKKVWRIVRKDSHSDRLDTSDEHQLYSLVPGLREVAGKDYPSNRIAVHLCQDVPHRVNQTEV